jgi:hypothetical protein
MKKYLAQIQVLSETITWKPVSLEEDNLQIDYKEEESVRKQNLDGMISPQTMQAAESRKIWRKIAKLTALFFGECGAGKSIVLSAIAKLYAELFPEACRG